MANERNFLLALMVVGITAVMLFQALVGLSPLTGSLLVANQLSAAPASADVLSVSPATQILKFGKTNVVSTNLEIYSSKQADVKISVRVVEADADCKASDTTIEALKGSQAIKLVCTAKGSMASSGVVIVTASSGDATTEAKIYLDSGS